MTLCVWCDRKIPEFDEIFWAEDDKKYSYPCCSSQCLNSLEQDDSINACEARSLQYSYRNGAL